MAFLYQRYSPAAGPVKVACVPVQIVTVPLTSTGIDVIVGAAGCASSVTLIAFEVSVQPPVTPISTWYEPVASAMTEDVFAPEIITASFHH